jgi:hypothetical protein
MWHIYLSVLLFILKADNLCGNGDRLAAASAKDSSIAFRQFRNHLSLTNELLLGGMDPTTAKSRNLGQSGLVSAQTLV